MTPVSRQSTASRVVGIGTMALCEHCLPLATSRCMAAMFDSPGHGRWPSGMAGVPWPLGHGWGALASGIGSPLPLDLGDAMNATEAIFACVVSRRRCGVGTSPSRTGAKDDEPCLLSSRASGPRHRPTVARAGAGARVQSMGLYEGLGRAWPRSSMSGSTRTHLSVIQRISISRHARR